MNPPDILRRLKTETAALHLEAERHVTILEPGATLDEYRRYLACMLGFHAPVERRFRLHTALREAGFVAEERTKAAFLREDLAALGLSAAQIAQLPECERLPDLASLPRALGCAYVLEGSTLGGRFILSRLPLEGAHGRATRFLECYGPRTGLQWRAFAGIVERAMQGPAAEEETVAAACATFQALIDWFQAVPGHREVRAEGGGARHG